MTADLGDLIDLVAAFVAAENGSARRARVRAGLSQSDLAATIGVAPSTLSRWENNRRKPTGPAAIRWIRALRTVAADELR